MAFINYYGESIPSSAAYDTKKPDSYYGLDIANGQFISKNERGQSLVPDGVDRFPKNSLTIINKSHAMQYTCSIVIDSNSKNTIASENKGYIMVGDSKYGVTRLDLSSVARPTVGWKLTVAAQAGDEILLIPDVPMEKITPEFIANGCMAVSDDFENAVMVATGERKNPIEALNGKTWLAMGDSYTQYLAGRYSDGITPTSQGKWGETATKYRMTLYSYGIASSTIRYDATGGSFQPMVRRIDDLITQHQADADSVGLITFMGGINDVWSDDKLGNAHNTDETKFFGACHQCFSKLVNAFPRAKIVVILQPTAANGGASSAEAYNTMTGTQLTVYAAQLKQRIVKEVAEMYGLTICDCCFDWYNANNPAHLAQYWKDDKLHLTSDGEYKLTEKLIKTLSDTL